MSVKDLIKSLNDNDPELKTYRQFWDSVAGDDACQFAEALKKNQVLTELTFEVTDCVLSG